MKFLDLKEGDYVRYRIKDTDHYCIGKAQSYGNNNIFFVSVDLSPSPDKISRRYDELSPLFCEELEIISSQEYFKEKLRGL